MASLSRRMLGPVGSLRQLCCRRAVFLELPTTTSRSLTSSAILRSAAKPRLGNAPSHAVMQSRYAVLKKLASKSTPTTLYEAPSHTWFYVGCWSGGLMLISWSLLTGGKSVKQPEGVPVWVGGVFGVSYLMLTGMGFWLLSKTGNIIGTIRVLPAQLARAAAGPTATQPSLQVEVAIKRMVPLLQRKVVHTSLDKVSLSKRLSLPDGYLSPAEVQAREREDKAKREALHKYDMQRLMTMPFRRLGRAVVAMFTETRRVWTDSGFGFIEVDGKTYKVDIMNGYSYDGFRTLEALTMKDR